MLRAEPRLDPFEPVEVPCAECWEPVAVDGSWHPEGDGFPECADCLAADHTAGSVWCPAEVAR